VASETSTASTSVTPICCPYRRLPFPSDGHDGNHCLFPVPEKGRAKHRARSQSEQLGLWEWQKCLVFPVSKLNDLQFSSKPYKWIRYCTGVVVGARGELSTERDSPNPVTMDYDSGISGVSIDLDLYYHIADQEKRRMFPIDGKIVGPRTVTSSRTSTRRDEFFEDVVVRDERCVVTGDSEYCDAAHLLPHSKGDKVYDSCMALSTLTFSSGLVYRDVLHAPTSRLQW
jgi:hypothetical protein